MTDSILGTLQQGKPLTSDSTIFVTHDPFMNSPSSMLQQPAAPAPTHQRPVRLPSDSSDDTKYEQFAAIHEKSSSFSSADKSFKSPAEKVASKRDSRHSDRRRQSRSSRDLEKGYARGGLTHDDLRSHRHGRSRRAQQMRQEELEEARQTQEDHALGILLFLAGPCVILSFLNALWTFVSIFITLFSQPVRLCARRPSFGQQLGGLLGPALNLQLKSIYTPLPPHANEDATYHPWMLVSVQLLSPFLSLGMMIAAWVVALFWFSSLVVGDPTGTDRCDDGSDTVLGLRKFWEKWLYRSVREEFV